MVFSSASEEFHEFVGVVTDRGRVLQVTLLFLAVGKSPPEIYPAIATFPQNLATAFRL